MRVVLISIINSFKYGNTGIDYIANHLRAYKTDVIDTKYFHRNESTEAIINDLLVADYEVFCFSVFETNYNQVKELAFEVKTRKNDAVVVIGGQFVSMNYKALVSDCINIDYFVLGDGESPIKRIIEHHKNENGILEKDENIATKTDFNGKKDNKEKDVNRMSDYDYFVYDSDYNNSQKTHCIMTKSNICTGNCTFCCSKKGRAVYKDRERIVSEIKLLSETYKVRKYFLTDDDLFDFDNDENRDRLNLLFDDILEMKLNITFSGFAKPISICNELNHKLLKKMKDVGFSHLFLGIDAGNEDDIKLYNKRSGLKEAKKSLEILKKMGISARFGLIFFNPYTSLKSMRENFNFLVEVQSNNYYHYGGLFAQLLEGTKLLEKVRADDLLKDSFSFLCTGEYNYANPEIGQYADFMRNDFLPKADAIRNQFNTLKRVYAVTLTVNEKAMSYGKEIEEYGREEFEEMRDFFECLYVKNDIYFCRNNLDDYIFKMKERTRRYKPIIRDLKDLYIKTPLKGDMICTR